MLSACNRESLPTVEEKLVGRWEWQQTADADQNTLTPANTGHQVVVEFDRRGRARFYQDGALVSAAAFSLRREMSGFGRPARQVIIYRGYRSNQVYTVTGNQLSLQETSGAKLAEHTYTRLVPAGPDHLPEQKKL
ncbi:hypothetical protein [Hymenobacter weizhouensis]|uniref:hypothetical protein n=1 Tax=Hymenobacter sp. YIM 151500-1 TaxID=2987689 RepID=UPI00222720AB|nr:hypothetical protein [Hymenobacter sp. YIM 151500-1]UYZ65122.1 hypothetical protein OIS53_09785 [Hymenobacter sp. YIM 151500-1]